MNTHLQKLLNATPQSLRLQFGELSAQEIRTIRAVLEYVAGEVEVKPTAERQNAADAAPSPEDARRLPAAPCSADVPRRRFDAQIRIGADSKEELVRAIEQIAFDVDRGATSCVSGGPDSGWSLTVSENPEMTHEAYIAALNAFMRGRQNAKGLPPADEPPNTVES